MVAVNGPGRLPGATVCAVTQSDFPVTSDVCTEFGWPPPSVVQTTASTNADLISVSGNGLIRVAHEQTAGKGRLGRDWVSRPGDGLTFSVRLEVPPTVSAWGWLPLMAGLAVADAVRASGVEQIGVKWPNDVVASGGKVAGILSVRDGSSAIVGIGINLDFAGMRPDVHAVSVAELGGDADADRILATVIRGLHEWLRRFVEAAGDADRCGLIQAYCDQCVTMDRSVTVAGVGDTFQGHVTGIDATGQLVVRTQDGSVRRVAAADVSLRA